MTLTFLVVIVYSKHCTTVFCGLRFRNQGIWLSSKLNFIIFSELLCTTSGSLFCECCVLLLVRLVVGVAVVGYPFS